MRLALRLFQLFALCGFTLVLVKGADVRADESEAPAHPGYIYDVNQERETQNHAIFVVFDIEEPKDASIREEIFNHRLTKEFKGRYEQIFGRTATERELDFNNPDSYYYDERGYTITSESLRKKERGFGEYMIRRLVEYHMDNKLKEDPKARQIYQLKENLRKAEVSIAKGYKLQSNYSISSNSIRVDFENPYLDTRIETDLQNVSKFEDTRESLEVSAWHKFTKTFRVAAHYSPGYGTMKVVGRKNFAGALRGDLTVIPNRRTGKEREMFGLAGLTYAF